MVMDFYSAYRHGFVRVAPVTHHTTLADRRPTPTPCCGWRGPVTTTTSRWRCSRNCRCPAISIEDILRQDALLDALLDIVVASADLLPVLVVGVPLRYRHRIYNTAVVIHRGRVLGVAPKSYLRTYREFYERRQVAAGDDVHGWLRIGDADVPFGHGEDVISIVPAAARGQHRRGFLIERFVARHPGQGSTSCQVPHLRLGFRCAGARFGPLTSISPDHLTCTAMPPHRWSSSSVVPALNRCTPQRPAPVPTGTLMRRAGDNA